MEGNTHATFFSQKPRTRKKPGNNLVFARNPTVYLFPNIHKTKTKRNTYHASIKNALPIQDSSNSRGRDRTLPPAYTHPLRGEDNTPDIVQDTNHFHGVNPEHIALGAPQNKHPNNFMRKKSGTSFTPRTIQLSQPTPHREFSRPPLLDRGKAAETTALCYISRSSDRKCTAAGQRPPFCSTPKSQPRPRTGTRPCRGCCWRWPRLVLPPPLSIPGAAGALGLAA